MVKIASLFTNNCSDRVLARKNIFGFSFIGSWRCSRASGNFIDLGEEDKSREVDCVGRGGGEGRCSCTSHLA